MDGAVRGQVAVFVDYENLALGVEKGTNEFLKMEPLMRQTQEHGRVVMARAYANWAHYCIGADGLGVELIHLPRGRARKSNAADIHLVADAAEVCWSRPNIGTFVLMTGDVDFVALVRLLQGHGRRVVGYGISGSTASRLVGECDEFFHVDKPRETTASGAPKRRRRRSRGGVGSGRMGSAEAPKNGQNGGTEATAEDRKPSQEAPKEKPEQGDLTESHAMEEGKGRAAVQMI